MAADKELFAFLVADDVNAGLWLYAQHAQFRPLGDSLRVGLGMPGMGRKIFFIKAAEKPRFGI